MKNYRFEVFDTYKVKVYDEKQDHFIPEASSNSEKEAVEIAKAIHAETGKRVRVHDSAAQAYAIIFEI